MQRENKWQDRFEIEFKENIYKTVPTDMDVKTLKIKAFIQSEIDTAIAETLKGQVYTNVKVTEEYEIPEHIVKTIRDTAIAEERGRVVEALKKSLKEEQKHLSLESSYGEGVYEGLVHSIHLVETLNK